MEAYWNKLSLDRPPTMSWRCATDNFDHKGFLNSIEKIIRELESRETIGIEAAILSRLIYRMKSKLRSDKGLKNMEKVNRSLLNFLRLSLEKDYKYLADNMEHGRGVVALPSRQMLQYVLVRTQGFAKLMCRIENTAEKASTFFRTRIGLGQAWNMSLVAYAVISRIWLLSRNLTKKCCKWYNEMYRYHDKLAKVGVSWLPETHSFPRDLKSWLNAAWIDEDSREIDAHRGLTNGIFTLISTSKDTEASFECANEVRDASSFSTKSIDNGEPSGMKSCKDLPRKQMGGFLPVLSDDIGKRISRDEFAADATTEVTRSPAAGELIIVPMGDSSDTPKHGETENTIKVKYKKKSKLHESNVHRIKTKNDVIEFMNSEMYPGLDKLQSNMLRKNVQKMLGNLKKSESTLNAKKQDLLLSKIIRCIHECIN